MRSAEPLISVIVPVRNGQEHLENCIRSIVRQTYERTEIIIVNDGSADRTGEICDRIAADHDNVRILTLGGEGVSAARNAGVSASSGELITFVDADDRLCPDLLRILYDCMRETESDVAGCDFFSWSSEEEWRLGMSADRATPQYRTYDAHGYLQDALLCGNSRCWSKLYRRAVFERVRFPEELTIGEDMLFLVRMISCVSRIAEADYKGYGYFRNPAGAMQQEFVPGYMDQVTCWRLAREEVLRIDRSLDAQVTALYMTGIMLTVGKIAMLPAARRRTQKAYVQICRESLREARRVPGARDRLSAGYRMKCLLFSACPALYLFLYHLQRALR